jgi:hypothetical protein
MGKAFFKFNFGVSLAKMLLATSLLDNHFEDSARCILQKVS